MAVAKPSIEQLQPFIDKEAIIHLEQADGTVQEVTGQIKAASVAGIALKQKGKGGLELISDVSKIYEIDYAPTKDKKIAQKKLKPIGFGQARQHLADRHGVNLAWLNENDEQAAFEWHEQVDHTDLGHIHVAEDKKADEREQAITES